MLDLSPTFPEFFKKNLKRALNHWTPASVVLGLLGAGLGIFSLYVYTSAIGRRDLFMPAIDAKSALAIWVLMVSLTMAAYLFILTATTWLYGISVSLFERPPRKQNRVARWLLLPLIIGFGTFILLLFFPSVRLTATTAVAIIAAATLLGLLVLFRFKRFRLLIALNTSRSVDEKQIFFVVMLALTLVFTIITAVFATSLVLRTYVGDDTPEAARFIALFSLGTLVLSLVPTFVFYTAKGHVYKRVVYGCAAAALLFLVFLLLARGAMTSITYAVANNLEIRQSTSARFILDHVTELNDLDNLQWRTRLHRANRVEVEAFQLFAFGKVLLLCPSDLLGLKLHQLPLYSRYCISTSGEKVSRKPLKLRFTERSAPSHAWRKHAESWVGWEEQRVRLNLRRN
ncbi:MAG TPA: hypothetical protein ENI17_11755 [Pseudomonas xinjiangensis]|uniref:Uncharacterized protein n=2 Tax=root TaxID=1 RepID=A0A7V1FQD0_9GAMM|nr:hypothetical protein [Halopseudomonas xinjiangensis]HEC48287.1 hypothetical protein [Halopseudomonas xinjiangensis]